MEAKHKIFKIPQNLELSASLPDEEKEFYGNYEDALDKFYLRSQMSSMTLLPNFQFGGWAAPSGWVATFPPGASFKQYPFCTEKYNSFTMVRLQLEGSLLTPERLKEIQLRETMCLSRKNLSPPTKESFGTDGWAASMEARGGAFIGIYKTQTKENDEVKEIFYAIAHVLLPDSYIDEQQQREVELQKFADECVASNGVRGKGCSFEKEFIADDGGQHQLRARQVGGEMAIRILIDWSRIVGIKLDVLEVHPDGDKEEFDMPSGVVPNPVLLEQALEFWPREAFIRPYSLVPVDVTDVPVKLRGYQLGRAIGELKKRIPDTFTKLQEKYKFRYSDEIITFVPDCQTMINSFKVMGTNQLVWYNNCTPATTNQPFLVFKGLEMGFDCYNYNPLTGKPFEEHAFHTSSQLQTDAFPVIYPYKRGERDVSKETIYKFCSPEGGGWLAPSFQPTQLKGTFVRGTTQGLAPPGSKITLEPVHVFLTGGDFYNTPVYNI